MKSFLLSCQYTTQVYPHALPATEPRAAMMHCWLLNNPFPPPPPLHSLPGLGGHSTFVSAKRITYSRTVYKPRSLHAGSARTLACDTWRPWHPVLSLKLRVAIANAVLWCQKHVFWLQQRWTNLRHLPLFSFLCRAVTYEIASVTTILLAAA